MLGAKLQDTLLDLEMFEKALYCLNQLQIFLVKNISLYCRSFTSRLLLRLNWKLLARGGSSS